MDFSTLRANKGNQFAAMQKKLEQTEKGGFAKDSRIWKPVAGKDLKADCVVRFLPISKADYALVQEGKAKSEDLTPMAKILSHAFQGPHGWFIEKSVQTFGEECPIRQHDGPLWGDLKKRGIKEGPEKDELKKRLPKTEYFANVLVIKDSTNPENNGKVFIYQFGENVRKMLEKANAPEFEGEVAFDPFDPWTGANLNLRLVYTQKAFNGRESLVPDFKNVTWATPAPIGDDARIEELWSQSYALQEFYDRSKFKSYDQLKEKFEKVMGIVKEGEVARPGSKLGSSAEKFVDDNQVAQERSAPVRDEPAPQSAAASDDLSDFENLLKNGS